MKHFQFVTPLALLVFLPSNGAVDLVVRVVKVPETPSAVENQPKPPTYLGVITSAPTNVTDPSAAKIVEVKPFNASQESNDEISWLMFWDENTKFMPLGLFTYFKKVKTLQIMTPFQGINYHRQLPSDFRDFFF